MEEADTDVNDYAHQRQLVLVDVVNGKPYPSFPFQFIFIFYHSPIPKLAIYELLESGIYELLSSIESGIYELRLLASDEEHHRTKNTAAILPSNWQSIFKVLLLFAICSSSCLHLLCDFLNIRNP